MRREPKREPVLVRDRRAGHHARRPKRTARSRCSTKPARSSAGCRARSCSTRPMSMATAAACSRPRPRSPWPPTVPLPVITVERRAPLPRRGRLPGIHRPVTDRLPGQHHRRRPDLRLEPTSERQLRALSATRGRRPTPSCGTAASRARAPTTRSTSASPASPTTLGTVDVAEAALELFPYWQREDTAAPTVVRSRGSRMGCRGADLEPAAEAGDEVISATSDAGSWSNIDVSTYVAELVAGADDFGLVLAGDESGATTWKRFVASGQVAELNLGPRLSITWSGLRPTGLAPSGLLPRRHVISWSHAGLAPISVASRSQISHDASDRGRRVGHVKGQCRHAVAVDDAERITRQRAATYSWRVRVKYGADKAWSEWSTPKTFTFGELVPKSL